MKAKEDIFKTLTMFIYRRGFGYKLPWPFLYGKKQINRDTTLEGDLGITGDDADEFLIAFGEEFNVDVDQFPLGDYFDDERDFVSRAIIRIFRNKSKPERKKLTVAHLEKAIKTGRLDDETISV